MRCAGIYWVPPSFCHVPGNFSRAIQSIESNRCDFWSIASSSRHRFSAACGSQGRHRIANLASLLALRWTPVTLPTRAEFLANAQRTRAVSDFLSSDQFIFQFRTTHLRIESRNQHVLCWSQTCKLNLLPIQSSSNHVSSIRTVSSSAAVGASPSSPWCAARSVSPPAALVHDGRRRRQRQPLHQHERQQR